MELRSIFSNNNNPKIHHLIHTANALPSEKNIYLNFQKNNTLTRIESEPKQQDSEVERINEFQEILMGKQKNNSLGGGSILQRQIQRKQSRRQLWEHDGQRGFAGFERKSPQIDVRKTYCFKNRNTILIPEESPEATSPYFRGYHQQISKKLSNHIPSPRFTSNSLRQLEDELVRERQHFQNQMRQKDSKIQKLEKLLNSKGQSQKEILHNYSNSKYYSSDPVPKFRNPFFSGNGNDLESRDHNNSKTYATTQQSQGKSMEQYQYLIREKEEHIQILITRIMELNGKIQQKNAVINVAKFENLKLDSEIESIRNHLYVTQQKCRNDVFSNNFTFTERQDEGRTRSLEKSKKSLHCYNDIRMTTTNENNFNKHNLEKIQERLLLLKTNRQVIEDRKKYRRQTIYHRPTPLNRSKESKQMTRDQTLSTNQGKQPFYVSFQRSTRNQQKSMGNFKSRKFKNQTFNS